MGEPGRKRLKEVEEKIPTQLKKFNLQSNESKKEKYQIPKPAPAPIPPPTWEDIENHKNDRILWSELDFLTYQPPPKKDDTPDWKKCKLLGSCLDTKTDIKRRKNLTLQNMKTIENLLLSNHLSVKLKIRLFDTYISSIMLYNSELWTLTPKLEKEIDAFHRRLLRKILNLGWPKKTTNEKLYHITKTEPWSTTIQRRRLKWTGHLLRLPVETPARQSTFEVLRPTKRNPGRPPLTWHKLIETDVRRLGFVDVDPSDDTKTIFDKLTILAENREDYSSRINCCMPRKRRLSREEQ